MRKWLEDLDDRRMEKYLRWLIVLIIAGVAWQQFDWHAPVYVVLGYLLVEKPLIMLGED